MGDLSNTASDIVGGLRVLRGIGGEQVFHDRYVRESQTTRRAGVEVARLQSVLDALQVFLPGVFVVVVVWLGARYAVQGRISAGELVAFYGYSAFLMIPLRTATEYANKVIRGRVAAAPRLPRALADARPRRARSSPRTRPRPAPCSPTRVPAWSSGPARSRPSSATGPTRPRRWPTGSGMCAEVVDDEVTLGGVALTALPRADVRRRIVVSDTGSTLFSGRLGDRLDVSGTGAVHDALATASTEDILEALADGMDTVVAERGRTFSGGQRQRLVLARALAADPEILVLVEPTSAVDAHTEARIAARLRDHRAGRTTVVVSSSPLVLDAVDEVVFLSDGRVAAVGTYGDLLGSRADFRAVVTREADPVGVRT